MTPVNRWDLWLWPKNIPQGKWFCFLLENLRDFASGVVLIPHLHENFKRKKNNEFRSMAIKPRALLPDINFIITIFCIIIRALATEGKWNFFMADSMTLPSKVNILSFAITRSFAEFQIKLRLARNNPL